MKTDKKIHEFILGMSRELNHCNDQVSVIHFGSSIHGQLKNRLDIDILLLSSKNYIPNDFDLQLNTFKSGMLAGNKNVGFNIDAGEIGGKIIAYINLNTNKKIKYIPVFVFGPFVHSSVIDSHFCVFLHFKGPITKEQFAAFCIKFPFHGKSILYNSVLVYGDFNREYFDSKIKLDKKEFLLLLNSLNLRVLKSNSKIDIQKCIKKMGQNYYLLKGVFTINKEDLTKKIIEDFMVSFPSDIKLIELKLQFTKIFEGIKSILTVPQKA